MFIILIDEECICGYNCSYNTKLLYGGDDKLIYLDNSATTKPYREVVDTVVDILQNHWGNASSDTSFGYDAKKIIDNVTEQVANDINCESSNIIWTSGACEANNLAILGVLSANPHMHFWTTRMEHASILEIVKNRLDIPMMFLRNTTFGFVDLHILENKLQDAYQRNIKTLVSIHYANSEIGAIQDIYSIAEIIHKYNGILHVDATQMYPWVQIDVQELGIDMMSVSGQKLHGVKGVGFLYVKDGIKLSPNIYGSQQSGRRGGTYSTHLIAAFGKALEITRKHDASEYVKTLRDVLVKKLLLIPNTTLNGPYIDYNRLVNNISLTIDGVSAGEVVALCDERGIMIAKGSACQSYQPTPSNTLLAIGLTEEQALRTIRISLDEFNTMEEINKAAKEIKEVVEILRKY